MKKIINYLSVVILSITAISMVSCNDKSTDVYTIVEYKLPDLYDLHIYEDIELTYTDVTGESVTESIKSTPWSKELKNITRPFTAKMEMKLKRKQGITFDKGAKLGSGYAILCKNSDGSSVGNQSLKGTFISISADKLENFLTKIESRKYAYELKIPVI